MSNTEPPLSEYGNAHAATAHSGNKRGGRCVGSNKTKRRADGGCSRETRGEQLGGSGEEGRPAVNSRGIKPHVRNIGRRWLRCRVNYSCDPKREVDPILLWDHLL